MESLKIQHLRRIVNNPYSDDVTYNLAKYILRHLGKGIEDMTINDLADACYTSVSSVSRFIKKIGYSSYTDFRASIETHKEVTRNELIDDNLDNMEFGGNDDRAVLYNFVEDIKKSLDTFVQNVDFDEIDELLELIHQHEYVYFGGTLASGKAAECLQFQLLNYGKYVEFIDFDNETLDCDRVAAEGLVIFFSVTGNFINNRRKSIYQLDKKNVRKVLITQNPNLKNSKLFDRVFRFNGESDNTAGRYQIQLISEIIFNRYFQKY